jgi:glutamyl-tRNA reductase
VLPIIFTKIKGRVTANRHLDDKSKEIVYHILRQVFKEIKQEEREHEEEGDRLFKEYFDMFGGKK